jgi:hypothetical protein
MLAHSPSKLGRAALAAAFVSVAGAWPARADVVDPSLPRTVVVGAPRGAAPSDRFDPRRTGRARTLLPAAPVEIWRRHVNGNVDVPPVVDEAGNIIVALTVNDVVKLGPDARELWRAHPSAPAAAPPALLADGTIAVVTTTGAAWGFTPAGAVRFVTPLGLSRKDLDTVPLALQSGGLLIAGGSSLVEIDADGVVRARATLDERGPGASGPPERALGAIVEGPGGALVTTASGSVYRFRPPAPPRKVGSFGGVPVRGAMVEGDRTLVAVVDGRRVVALDLPTGTTHVRSGGLVFDAPPTLGPNGLVYAGTQIGMLLGIDAAGNEKVHVLLDKSQAPVGVVPGGGTFIATADAKPSPPLVIDPTGRVAFIRPTGRAGFVSPEGKVEIISDRVCATPLAVLPGGEKRLLVACRDGLLSMYGE